MKKLMFMFFLLFVCWFNFSLWEDIVNESNENILNEQLQEDVQTETLELSLWFEQLKDNEINNIRWRFCVDNNSKTHPELRLNLRPNELKNICFVFGNDSRDTYQLKSQLLPTTYDAGNNLVCKSNYDQSKEDIFGIVDISDLEDVELFWGAHIVKNITIKAPKNYSGELSFCLNYEITNIEKDTFGGGMFKIRSVKSNKWFLNIWGKNYPELLNLAQYSKNFWYLIIVVLSLWLLYYIISSIKKSITKSKK